MLQIACAWQTWHILRHKILELLWSHLSLQNVETITQWSAGTHWVYLKVNTSISTTSNRNGSLFLIKAQTMTNLHPKTTFKYPPFRGLMVALFKRFCLLWGVAGLTSRSYKKSTCKLPFVVALIGECLEGGKEDLFPTWAGSKGGISTKDYGLGKYTATRWDRALGYKNQTKWAQHKLIISYTRQRELLFPHSLPHQGCMTLRGETIN